jgi:hypothetical protein
MEAPILSRVPPYCKRRKSTTSTNGASESDTPKAFTNMIREPLQGYYKPVNFSLLSVHDPDTSRKECERILHGLGLRAVSIHADGPGILKSWLDEISGPAEVMGVTKTVRFRVEDRGARCQWIVGGCEVSDALLLVQEKGAASSFRVACSRVRREWGLDAPKSPLLPPRESD